MVEQKYFFTMSSSKEIPAVTTGGSLFSRSTKLRYRLDLSTKKTDFKRSNFSGRVERELVNSVSQRKESGIKRSLSNASAPSRIRTLGRSQTLRTPRATDENSSPESLRNKGKMCLGMLSELTGPFLSYVHELFRIF